MTLGVRGRHAARFAWHYVRRTEVEHFSRAAAFVRRTWCLGLAERLVLGGVLVLAALSGAAGLLRPGTTASVMALSACHLAYFTMAWSVALAVAASRDSPLVLIAIAPWLAFYQVLACGASVGTPVAVLPAAWLLWALFRLVARVDSWWRRMLCWLVVAAGAGYVGAGPSGLRRALGWTPRDAQFLLFSVLSVAGLLALLLVRRRGARPMSFASALTGALLTSAVAIGVSASRDWLFTVDWTRTMVGDAGAIVVLFWMWAAGSFAASALKLAGWGIRRAGRIVPAYPARFLFIAVVTAVTAWEVVSAADIRLDRLEREVLIAHVAAGVLAVSAIVWLWVRDRLSRPRLILLTTWWVVAWMVLHGLHASSLAVVATRLGSHEAAGAGLFVIAAGLALELGRMERDWPAATAARVRGQLGLVALAVACAVILTTTPGAQWESSRSLMVLAGMLHLGVPLALHDGWSRRGSGRCRFGVWPRVAVFATGYATALAILVWEPVRAAALAAAIPVLVVVLVVLVRVRPVLVRASGALAGALFGGGLVAGWMMPYPPTIPFLPPPPWIAVLRDWGALGRPPLSIQHLGLLVTAWVTGGAIGWFVFRTRATASESGSAARST